MKSSALQGRARHSVRAAANSTNAAADGHSDDKPRPNPPRARTILSEPDSSGRSWFSRPVRGDRASGDRKNRVANPRRAFQKRPQRERPIKCAHISNRAI